MNIEKIRVIKKIAAVGLSLALVIGVTACGSKDTASDSAEKKNAADTLNIAFQPAPGYIPLKLLSENGWLDEALKEAGYDIDVNWTEFESGPPENESFAAGQQDIGVMGNVPSIAGKAAGQDRTYIGISTNGEQTEGIVVKEDSEIKTVADLKGKKVGLVVGSIVQDLLDRLLKRDGLTSDDIEVVNLATSEQIEALATGQVDAIATWAPTLTKSVNTEGNKLLADGTGIFLAENTIFGRTEYINANPEIVQIFIRQYARAAQEIKGDIDGYAEKYKDYYGLDKDLLVSALEGANFPIAITDEDVEDLQITADFLYDNEFVKNHVTVKDAVDFTFIEDEDVKSYLTY